MAERNWVSSALFQEDLHKTDISQLLGDEAQSRLEHACSTIAGDALHLPGPDYVDRVVAPKDLSPGVLRNLQCLFNHGRLGGSAYLSLLPVDQDMELLNATQDDYLSDDLSIA